MEKNKHLPLHDLRVDKLTSTINRTYVVVHAFFLSIFLYHRLSSLFLLLPQPQPQPLLPWLLLFLAELLLSILWLFKQAYRISPTNRTVFVDRLPEESKLPAVDVLICTTDPEKEPTVEVMNTVVSAMSLDYPADKLHVYLSDDGGASVTLRAVKEAWGFATWWLPFCRKYGVKCSCPLSYFENQDDDQDYATSDTNSSDFIIDKLKLREKYEVFKERVQKLGQEKSDKESRNNHPPLVQVINEKFIDYPIINPDHTDIPQLVYVAREKRPSHPHHFKAGALNAFLRVSGMLSNSPVVLVLDCDMFCNDPTSAKQAMCFYLDPEISPSLGFVQFPQRFRNVSKNNIYDTDLRWVFKVIVRGMDGLGTGTMLCGTCFYMNRKALYDNCVKGLDIMELRHTFGPSNEFIKTLSLDIKPKVIKDREISKEIIREGKFLASCLYENETNWGKGVGFFYYSVVEDIFTGYHLHCRGWKSVYHDPEKAAFLGITTTNLNDVLTQTTRWSAGLLEVGLSRFCPLVHGLFSRRLPILSCICYAWADVFPLNFISAWCFAVIPQLCLLQGINIYPKVSSSVFVVVAFIFLSSLLMHLYEVVTAGGTVESWWNEQRMWVVKMLTCDTYGSIDAIMKIIGLKNTSFIPTNKFIDDEQEKRYQQGIYDFQTSNMFLVPLGTIVILNLVCLIGGLVRLTVAGKWDEMAAQVFFSGFFLVMSKPIIEGMFVRKDKGRFPISATLISIAACLVVLVLGLSSSCISYQSKTSFFVF